MLPQLRLLVGRRGVGDDAARLAFMTTKIWAAKPTEAMRVVPHC